MVDSRKFPHVLEHVLLLGRVFCVHLLDLVDLLCCSSLHFVYLLSCFTFITESGSLTSSTIIIELSVSPFSSVSLASYILMVCC